MSNLETGKVLAKVAAIMGIIFGFVEIGVEAFDVIYDLVWYGSLYTGGIIWIAAGVIAVVFGFLILVRFIPMVDADAQSAGIYILIFGLIGSIGVWSFVGWIVGALYVVAAILILIEGQGGA